MSPGTTGRREARLRWAGLAAGPLAGVAVFLLLPGADADAAAAAVGGLTAAGRATAAVGALMAVWWLTEAVPLSATAVVPIALLPLVGARSIGEVTAPYADPVIFLLFNTLLPVLGGAGAAAALGVDAALLLVPAAIAASYAFMLPVATPPNAIVFGSGYVRLAQIARAGFWLNLAGALLAATMAYFFAGSLLDLDLRGKG